MSYQPTKRELEICRLVSLGKSNKEIARKFATTEGAAGSEITRLCAKLFLNNRVQLAVWYVKQSQEDPNLVSA